MTKVAGFPLHIKLDPTFTPAQHSELLKMIALWNERGRAQIGQNFFFIESPQMDEAMRTADPRNCAAFIGGKNWLYVMRETSKEHWERSLGFNRMIPGVTIRCALGDEVARQVVLLYDAVIPDPKQFASIVLHELGHVLGLDHSCQDSQGGKYEKPEGSFRACPGLAEDHEYRVAVMYPSLRSRITEVRTEIRSEIKETLMANDILRNECLYAPRLDPAH